MHTLLRQALCRLFSALTHGLQAMPAQTGVFRAVAAAKSSGVSGPNNVTDWMGVSAAK